MVGTHTALMDDPQLTAREWPGPTPLRIVIDRQLKLPQGLKLFDHSVPTLVLTEKERSAEKHLEFVRMDFSSDILPQLMAELFRRKISSLIVEGGRKLLASFIRANLWDEARVLSGPVNFGHGVEAPVLDAKLVSQENQDSDQIRVYRPL